MLPVSVVAVVMTGLAIHGMLAYWRGYIPFDGTTWETYLDSLTTI